MQEHAASTGTRWMSVRGCRYLCRSGSAHSSHLRHLWASTAVVQQEPRSLRQGQPTGFHCIPLSSVAEVLWKDLGQVQRKSTLAGRTLDFFFFFPEHTCKNEAQYAAKRSSHSVRSRAHRPCKGQSSLSCSLSCWDTRALTYRVLQEQKRVREGDAETKYFSSAANTLPGCPGPLTVLLWGLFLLVKIKLVLQTSSPVPLTGQSCIFFTQVLSSWMLCLHAWFLRLLFTSGLPSQVPFPLYPG